MDSYVESILLSGNISQLKEEHQKETAEVLKMQEVNKARMQQGLQAKLQARRQKKHVEWHEVLWNCILRVKFRNSDMFLRCSLFIFFIVSRTKT